MFVLVGVLIFSGAGCSNTNVAPTETKNEPLKLSKGITMAECAGLFAFAPKIDLRYNDLSVSYPWTLKYYDRMAELEKKYSITQDELGQICKPMKDLPGFDKEVEKQTQELNKIIK